MKYTDVVIAKAVQFTLRGLLISAGLVEVQARTIQFQARRVQIY
jgi:hypothetical protein